MTLKVLEKSKSKSKSMKRVSRSKINPSPQFFMIARKFKEKGLKLKKWKYLEHLNAFLSDVGYFLRLREDNSERGEEPPLLLNLSSSVIEISSFDLKNKPAPATKATGGFFVCFSFAFRKVRDQTRKRWSRAPRLLLQRFLVCRQLTFGFVSYFTNHKRRTH